MRQFEQAYLSLMRQRRPIECSDLGEEALAEQAREVAGEFNSQAVTWRQELLGQWKAKGRNPSDHEQKVRLMNEAKIQAEHQMLEQLEAGIEWERIIFTQGQGRHEAADKNKMVWSALLRDCDQFIFAEADMMPRPKDTNPLFDAPYDLSCVRYDTECGAKAWPDAQSFHTGIWTARREVLESIGFPLFHYPTNPAGTEITGCTCSTIAIKARRLGYTTGHAGTAGHTPQASRGFVSLQIIRDIQHENLTQEI